MTRRNVEDVLEKVLSMNVDDYKGREIPKKTWIECVKDDTARMDINTEITANSEALNKREEHIAPTPNKNWDKGRKIMMMSSDIHTYEVASKKLVPTLNSKFAFIVFIELKLFSN